MTKMKNRLNRSKKFGMNSIKLPPHWSKLSKMTSLAERLKISKLARWHFSYSKTKSKM